MMQGQTTLFHNKQDKRLEISLDPELKANAREKAKREGYSLAWLIKCFLMGYLAGDYLGSEIVSKYDVRHISKK